MRSFAVVLALAPLAAFAGLIWPRQSAPPCLETCLANLPTNVSTCDPTDYTCLCEDQGFLTAVTACIDANCTTSDVETAEEYAVAICAEAGVTVTPAPIPSATGSSTLAGITGSSTGGSASPTSASASSSPTAKANAGRMNVPALGGAAAAVVAMFGVALAL